LKKRKKGEFKMWLISIAWYVLLAFVFIGLSYGMPSVEYHSFQQASGTFFLANIFMLGYLSFGIYKAYFHNGVKYLIIASIQLGLVAYFLTKYKIWYDLIYWVVAVSSLVLAYVETRLAAGLLDKRKQTFPVATAYKDEESKPGYTNLAVPARYTFDDVVGMDEFKKRFLKAAQEVVGEGLKAQKFSSKKRRQLERKGKLNKPADPSARNGILLFGEPGNGKTFFAEALAGELKLPIINSTFGDMASKWVNETTENVRKVFDDAVAQAPCVLFLDEIDSVISKRDSVSNADSETQKTTNTVLTRLVDLRDKGVLIIAATNFIDKIDAAAKREGRFDYKIEVPVPDEAARKNILELTLKKNLPSHVIALPDAIAAASKRWEGYSVSRLKAVGLEVASYAKDSAGIHTITFEHMMDALRRIQGSKGQRISENIPTLDQLTMNQQMSASLIGIANRMINIEETEALGGSVPTGLLFFGPPGTGKTYIAQSLAKTTGWAFIATSGQDILSRPERIDEIIATAKDLRPCIIMVDECDDVFADRTSSPWTKSITNKLLQIMDGAGGKAADILWIAATNHPDKIDSAALRGGRFTEKIEFELPESHVVASFIEKWMGTTRAKFHSELTPEHIAQLLGSVSLANVKEIMQTAVNNMIGRKSAGTDVVVTREDIEKSMATVIGY
jgi:transitional endoplasmic reticulum ATPase